eukprot:gene5217-10441_t
MANKVTTVCNVTLLPISSIREGFRSLKNMKKGSALLYRYRADIKSINFINAAAVASNNIYSLTSPDTLGQLDVIKLEAVNFELALTSYPYVAILFSDGSEKSNTLEENWDRAGNLLGDFNMDGELAKMNAADPEMQEIIDAYRLASPCIKIFRRGTMVDYRGPYDAEGIAEYIRQDIKPSVKILKTLDEVTESMKNRKRAMVLGFFGSSDVTDDSTDMYSMDAWGQFQAAADSLRGHAQFYMISSLEAMKAFSVDITTTPIVYLIPEESDSLMSYPGEIIEVRLVEWILRNSPPTVGELSFASNAGELYATQFFSSKLLKFILFLPSGTTDANANIIELWKKIAPTYNKKVAFAYMIGDTVPDVLEYFDVTVSTDIPLIVAHNPTKDYKYKSSKKIPLTVDSFHTFVNGVINGDIRHILKSEAIPKVVKGSHVVRAVGNNILSIVNDPTKDVLVEVYTSTSCTRCKSLAPTYDILGKAFQGEDRVLIVKIDGQANDLPSSWVIRSFPTLLWFPASDKPYASSTAPVPKPYWDAGVSLHELVSFIIRHSSFDTKSLKVATSEQLGSLLGDEELLREKYEKEEQWNKRNEGRKVYDNEILDYLLGEVVFDGVRWHLGLDDNVCHTLTDILVKRGPV